MAESPQSETTPFYPRSPYAVSKVFAHWMTVQYREAYGVFAVNGIMFNHESPRRGATFVTRKVPRYFRPTEVDELCGDASKARNRLGWQPQVTFTELVRLILEVDLREAGLDPDRHLVAAAAGSESPG